MLQPFRKTLAPPDQADVHPALGLIFIDSAIHEEEWPRVIGEALREMIGDGSPYAYRARRALELIEGELGASG